ncbi:MULTISPECIES: asparagine synthase-related protein [Chitinophagaceae]
MKGFQLRIQNGEVHYDSCIVERAFDNYIVMENDLVIQIEGIVLNKVHLQVQYPNVKHLYHFLYLKFGKDFISQLEGEVVGFVWDRRQQLVWAFTNFTATRKLFYFNNGQEIIVDTSLIRLNALLRNEKIAYSLNEFSMYTLMVCGNMLENNTPIQEIKKLCDAEILEIDVHASRTTISSYNKPQEKFSGSKHDALKILDDLFVEATCMEFEKDQELNKESFALLSGGLDSRMTLLVALENNFPINEAFCFSQKGYWDEIIARKVAKDHNIPFHFVSLNGGKYITAIEEIFQVSEGLGVFSGALHTNYAYRYIDKSRFGVIHSGQLGDGVLGSFNKHPFPYQPTKEKIVVHPRLFHQMEEGFNKIVANYDREEIFLTRNVGYNRTVLGSHLAENISYQTSPFMYSKLIQFAQSLPEAWKYNQRIYIEWINQYHPRATQYRWERTLLRPTSHFKTIIGDQLAKRAYNVLLNKIGRQLHRGNMTAYNYYYQRDPALIRTIDQYFYEHIDRVSSNTLKQDMLLQFKYGAFIEKTGALTVLSVLKNYF